MKTGHSGRYRRWNAACASPGQPVAARVRSVLRSPRPGRAPSSQRTRHSSDQPSQSNRLMTSARDLNCQHVTGSAPRTGSTAAGADALQVGGELAVLPPLTPWLAPAEWPGDAPCLYGRSPAAQRRREVRLVQAGAGCAVFCARVLTSPPVAAVDSWLCCPSLRASPSGPSACSAGATAAHTWSGTTTNRRAATRGLR